MVVLDKETMEALKVKFSKIACGIRGDCVLGAGKGGKVNSKKSKAKVKAKKTEKKEVKEEL